MKHVNTLCGQNTAWKEVAGLVRFPLRLTKHHAWSCVRAEVWVHLYIILASSPYLFYVLQKRGLCLMFTFFVTALHFSYASVISHFISSRVRHVFKTTRYMASNGIIYIQNLVKISQLVHTDIHMWRHNGLIREATFYFRKKMGAEDIQAVAFQKSRGNMSKLRLSYSVPNRRQ